MNESSGKNARFYWHFSGLLQVYFRCSPTLLPIHFRYTFVISPIGVEDKNRVKGGSYSSID